MAVMSAKSASDAEKKANKYSMYQDLIDVENLAQETAIQEYGMRQDLSSLESEQVAQTAAMGKRSSGEGMQRMQEVARGDMESNIQRMQKGVELSRKYGKVSAGARESASKAKEQQRNLQAGAGLLSGVSKLYGGGSSNGNSKSK